MLRTLFTKTGMPFAAVMLTTSLLALAGSAGGALAQFAPELDLGDLDGTNGSRFAGHRPGDVVGRGVSSAGDVNGDGRSDFIIGAPDSDHDSKRGAGAAYVVFGEGKPYPPNVNLSRLDGKNGFRIVGPRAGAHAGYSVSAAGDMNGDGFGDIVIGSPGTGTALGSAYVVFGKRGGFDRKLNLADIDGRNGFRIKGAAASGRFGYRVTGIGDHDGDGFDDIAIGEPYFEQNKGRGYVVLGHGKRFPKVLEASSIAGRNGFRVTTVANNGFVGTALSGGNDINGDGLDELLIGLPLVANGTEPEVGVTVALFGVYGGGGDVNLNSMAASRAVSIRGSIAGERSGQAVAGAGDFDGDGYDDIVIGGPHYEFGADTDAGAAYVVFGTPNLKGNLTLPQLIGNGFAHRFIGSGANRNAGAAVAGTGDVNGDGFDDLLIGSQDSVGESYLVLGTPFREQLFTYLSELDGMRGMRISAAASSDLSGWSLSGAGDVNHDGFADMLIGAEAAKTSAGATGAAYLLRGAGLKLSTIMTGGDGDQTMRGSPEGDFIFGLGGNDTLEGRAGADFLHGGLGGNTASYEFAPSGVVASLGNPAVNTGHAEGDIYDAIHGLRGSRHNDRLIGDAGPNGIAGLHGRDVMSGGGGITTYFYTDPRESPPGRKRRDVITDFNPGTATTTVDRIQLFTMDAKKGVNGHQLFKYIGKKAFSRKKGELRITRIKGKVLVQADVTGDGKPDFEIHLRNLKSLKHLDAGDFLLSAN